MNRYIDDLIRMAQPTTEKQTRLLRDFCQLVHDHPELLDQLYTRVLSRLVDNRAASVHASFEQLRWDAHLHMQNGLAPLLARALLYLHPDLNGQVRLVSVPMDDALGMRVCEETLSGDYAPRLEWWDGRSLDLPMLKNPVLSRHLHSSDASPVDSVPTRGNQRELFTEVA